MAAYYYLIYTTSFIIVQIVCLVDVFSCSMYLLRCLMTNYIGN